jgi:hypothetical protein
LYKEKIKLLQINKLIYFKMETLEKIKTLTESLSVDTTKFYAGNKSAGTRARKTAQEIKAVLQELRAQILTDRK